MQELISFKEKYDELIEQKDKENNENNNIINKIKIELNETKKENILIKNELELKRKEIENLNNKLSEYKNKKMNIT